MAKKTVTIVEMHLEIDGAALPNLNALTQALPPNVRITYANIEETQRTA